MKIYFTSSTAEFDTYKKTYFGIRDYLVQQGHLLTRDWLPETSKRIGTYQLTDYDIKYVYNKCIQAIRDTDLVIIEDTVSNFSTGHQITLALEMNKPTLVLWQKAKHKHFRKMFIHGIESDYLEVRQYTPNTLEGVIDSFIAKYKDIEQRNRFHLVINGMERNYLDWAQFNKNKSRTRVIRESIRKSLEKDKDYQKYLKGSTK